MEIAKLKLAESDKCTGCTACSAICPTNCIEMKENEEGFMHPQIQNELCISCNQCSNVCPIMKERSNSGKWIYSCAAWSKSDEIRLSSTSGGIFYELASVVIELGGYVVGAAYDNKFEVYHEIVNNLEGIRKLRQSKYVESDLSGVFIKIKELLTKAEVMFVGTPCQVEGLVSFLGGKPDNLLLCDFICRGNNSRKAYREYLHSLEKEYNSKVERVWFKNKEIGWNKFQTRIDFENGKTYYADRYNDSYMIGFLKHNAFIRESCYDCQFKGFSSQSDITYADYWGIKLPTSCDIEKGISLVVCKTDVGINFFHKIEDKIEKVDNPLSTNMLLKYNPCAYESIDLNEKRKVFFGKIEQLDDFVEIIKYFDEMKEG